MLQEAWGLAQECGRALLVDAESKLMELNFINLEPKRSFTVAESVLWIELCGLRFAAQVAAMVSLEELPKVRAQNLRLQPRTPPPSATAIARPPPLPTT